MRLIKKHQQKELSTGNTSVSDKMAEKIAFVGISIQRIFSTGMNKLFSNMTSTTLKLVLILFCLCTGSYNIYLVISSTKTAKKNEEVFNISHLVISKQLISKIGQTSVSNNQIDDATIRNIRKFKSYIDSLKNECSYLYDSIIRSRPLLMDSVLELEKIYLSQKNEMYVQESNNNRPGN